MACVATGASASAVLSSVEQHSPNAFILDLSLDDGPSLPLISQLRVRLPGAVIVVFTGHKNEFDELTAALRRAARANAEGRTSAAGPAADGLSADG